jgi:adenylosuccinate lyase
MSRLARALAIDPATLSNWFHRGDTSARIAAAVSAIAQQLTNLEQERVARVQKLKALDEEITELKKRRDQGQHEVP